MKSLCTLLLLCCAIWVQANTEEKELLQEAEQLMFAKQYPDAEAKYKAVLSKFPNSLEAKHNLASAQYLQGRMDEAAVHYKDALDVAEYKGEKAQINYNMGTAYLHQQNYGESIEAYKNALRNDPTDAQAKYNLSYALKKQKEQENQDNQDQNNQQKDQQEQEKEQQPKESQMNKEAAEQLIRALLDREQEQLEEQQQEEKSNRKNEKDW